MHHVPYGLSSFPTIRREGGVYVDESSSIRNLEMGAQTFAVFLRPRRFGGAAEPPTPYEVPEALRRPSYACR